MTATIAYDKPVKNLIDQLNATGHVTHTAYRKTSVTLHHNAGRNTHEQVLTTWKTREASTHFDVDARGDVCQFVKVNEYAWAVGNTQGNMSTISIEMCNETLAPAWKVADPTWQGAARLAGWLFAKVIGERPSSSNLFYHHHWYSTACAGPHMDEIYGKVLLAAQAAYDQFKGASAPKPPGPAPGGTSNAQIAAEVWAGKWGNGDDRVSRLTKAGYDAKAIQALVDQGVGKNASPSPAPPKKSIATVAQEVMAGQWGNGDDRVQRLTKAGYNAAAVQAEVNKHV